MQTKIFKNQTLNNFTKTNSLFAISLYTIISVMLYVYGCRITENLAAKMVYPLVGVLLFTLIEYIVHRFAYHSGPDYMDSGNWQYKVHGVHHDFPRDKDRLAMPIWLALTLAVVLYMLFYLAFGVYVNYFFPGFFIGYASYLLVHYIVHTHRAPKNFLKYLWVHHHIHHHKQPEKAFGVTSPLWDWIFGTMPVRNNRK